MNEDAKLVTSLWAECVFVFPLFLFERLPLFDQNFTDTVFNDDVVEDGKRI